MQQNYHVLIDYSDKSTGSPAEFYVDLYDSLPPDIKTWDVKMLACSHRKGTTAADWTVLAVKSSLVPGVIGGNTSLKNNLLGLQAASHDEMYLQPVHRIEKPVLNNVKIELIANDDGTWGSPTFGSAAGTSTTILLEFKPVYQNDIQDRYLDSLKKIWKPL